MHGFFADLTPAGTVTPLALRFTLYVATGIVGLVMIMLLGSSESDCFLTIRSCNTWSASSVFLGMLLGGLANHCFDCNGEESREFSSCLVFERCKYNIFFQLMAIRTLTFCRIVEADASRPSVLSIQKLAKRNRPMAMSSGVTGSFASDTSDCNLMILFFAMA